MARPDLERTLRNLSLPKKPDRRRLHGWATPGGIVFRDLSNPHRETLIESDLAAIMDRDRVAAAMSLQADGEGSVVIL